MKIPPIANRPCYSIWRTLVSTFAHIACHPLCYVSLFDTRFQLYVVWKPQIQSYPQPLKADEHHCADNPSYKSKCLPENSDNSKNVGQLEMCYELLGTYR